MKLSVSDIKKFLQIAKAYWNTAPNSFVFLFLSDNYFLSYDLLCISALYFTGFPPLFSKEPNPH